ncbi:MAG TPA: hemolysin family protein [Spirochaetota bacterium]|nr:MAG: Magnesium and cobalt efflux protein CorC [Spirochaetes bacterium ADurb.BinA120]HPO46217.1 hemolysin family protein [Spirochaetota bacterium]
MTSDSSDLPHPPGRSALGNLLLKMKEVLGRSRNPIASNEAPQEGTPAPETAEQEMIRGVMGLSSKNVREIMIPRIDVVAVSTSITLNALVKVIDDVGHSRIPVYNETIDNIAGILYVKELLPFIANKPRKFELKKMLHRPYFVPETMPLDDLLVEFKRRRLHLACVVDEYGGFGGIITLEDVIEEIVGDIKDEFDDNEPPEIRKIGRNTYEIDSRMTLTDFNEEAGTRLPTDEFDTIGGLVFDLFGKIPKKNETARFENISFKIKEIKGTRLTRVIVTISRTEQ